MVLSAVRSNFALILKGKIRRPTSLHSHWRWVSASREGHLDSVSKMAKEDKVDNVLVKYNHAMGFFTETWVHVKISQRKINSWWSSC